MSIMRKIKKSDYTVIDNNIFKNPKLSLKAKGMICTMLSLPDDWNYSEEGLAQLSNDSRTSVRSSLKELMELGYLTRTRERSEDGKLGESIYTIYEEPMYQNPTLEKPTLENVHNKILNNKILNNKKENNTKERFKKPTLQEIEDYCLERHSSVNPKVFFDYFETGGWRDSKGNKVKNWKQKIITWERNSKPKQEADVPSWFNQDFDTELTEEERKEFDELLS